MMLRKISASYVFTLSGEPIKNGIVIIDEHGTVVDVINPDNEVSEIEGLEFYSGILCPGFVNTHCHLELSHLKDKIAEKTGLPDFLRQIVLLRNVDEEFQLLAARQTDQFMWRSGIVAVGDITNSSLSLEIKENSKIFYHSFLECFGFLPQRAPRAMEYADFLSHLYTTSKQQFSITPHATYSVSDELFQLIVDDAIKNQSIISLHHQESDEENKLFRNKSGNLLKHYQENLKMDIDFWQPTGKSSTQSIISKIPKENQLLLVHNTFLNEEDLAWIKTNRHVSNTFFVLCPNSNLYIENRLPDIGLLRDSGFRICLGTDSLSSNHSLSVLKEVLTLNEYFDGIELNELLKWACLNGAQALKIEDWAGSIEIGKKPGINLITGIDWANMKLLSSANVKKLI
jgi:aminodeoxyfutalosine deaminase